MINRNGNSSMERNQNGRKYPSMEEAKAALAEAALRNPGNWVPHSEYTAMACKAIAERCENLDAEKSFVLGLLHDIGRYVGVVKEKHQIAGYQYCMERGWEDAARICLTHSHPTQVVSANFQNWDIPYTDCEFLRHFVEETTFDDYDRLIQLCDCLAMPYGFCIIEKRFVDVGLRYGVSDHSIIAWKKVIELKKYFEKETCCSIYQLLPGIFDNL